ncbi:acetylgalactosaminyl-O-glycosyl-glycoprotein beta-1,3-N-acetylglucosaminyltransferase-like [Ciona intestinalis]
MVRSWLMVVSLAKLRMFFMATLVLWLLIGLVFQMTQESHILKNSSLKDLIKSTKTDTNDLRITSMPITQRTLPKRLAPIRCNNISECHLRTPYSEWTRNIDGTAYVESEGLNQIHCQVKPANYSSNQARMFESLPKNFLEYSRLPTAPPFCGRRGLLSPWKFTESTKEIWMIFIVKSATHHMQARDVIRETWGSIESLRGTRFATLFLLGRTSTSEEQFLLNRENEMFGDILQCDLLDEYKALPLKVLSSFRWLLEGHMTSSYYTVTDDDCVMNLMNINTFFHVERYDDVIYCGFIFDQDSKVNRQRKSKWYISKDVYPGLYYPTFCHGGMWSLQKPMMRDVYCMAEVTQRNEFYLEDVYITGILREKLGRRDSNILPATTNSGSKYLLMYYPWDETNRAYIKMTAKWRKLNRTLPWGINSSSGEPLVESYKPQTLHTKQNVKLLLLQWSHLKDAETNRTI